MNFSFFCTKVNCYMCNFCRSFETLYIYVHNFCVNLSNCIKVSTLLDLTSRKTICSNVLRSCNENDEKKFAYPFKFKWSDFESNSTKSNDIMRNKLTRFRISCSFIVKFSIKLFHIGTPTSVTVTFVSLGVRNVPNISFISNFENISNPILNFLQKMDRITEFVSSFP